MAKVKRPYADKKGAYAFYRDNLLAKMKVVEDEMLQMVNMNNGYHLMVKTYLPHVSFKSPVDLSDWKNFIGYKYDSATLDYRIIDFRTEDGLMDKSIFIKYIRLIVKNNKKIAVRKQRLAKLRRSDIPPQLHNVIIDLMFNEIAKYIIKGGTFNFKNKIGKLFAYRAPAFMHRTLDGDFTYNLNHGETQKRKRGLLATGHKEEDLWSAEKFNKVIDDYMDQGYTLLEAKTKAKKDPRSGIPYAVFCDEEVNFWIKYLRPKGNRNPELKRFKWVPSQDFLRRFQRYAKGIPNSNKIYPFIDYRKPESK